MVKVFYRSVMLSFIFCAAISGVAQAKSAREIDASVSDALDRFRKEVGGAEDLLSKAKGVLIIPKVVKAGFIVGGEYGEGALLVGGKTADYYSTASASFGLQIGGQVKNIYLLFLDRIALKQFQVSDGWEVGLDGSVALITVGVNGGIDTTVTNQPIVGFVLGQKGLMYNLSIEGTKFTKLKK